MRIDRGLLPMAFWVSAAFYGGKVPEDRLDLFDAATKRLAEEHRGRRWWRSSLNLRSLVTRGP
jgi:hypothetical protein